MSTSMWKLEKDLCRCCHAEGSYKNLAEPSFQLGQEEIYSDMLQECLDIKIVPMMGELSEITYTICNTCIVRLRDASNFKRQVQDCEERFKDLYSRNLIKAFDVKEEPIALSDNEDYKQEFHSMDDDDDTSMKFDDDDDLEDSQSLAELEKMKGKSKAKPKPKPKPKQPVKKVKVKKSIKEEKPEVTEPAASGEKKKGQLELEMRSLPYVSVVRDGTFLRYCCGQCNSLLNNVYSMKRHVLSLHTQVKCPICGEEFKTTSKKAAHLFKAHNLEEVGKGPLKELKERRMFQCDYCKKEFTRRVGINRHISYMHILRKCPECPSMFTEKDLSLHRNHVHGYPIPTCGICGYINNDEGRMLLHQRQVHLKERTVPCKICDLKFFNVRYLNRHLIKHRPEKIHECSFCHKKFPRMNTLRLHEKIHKGEKNKVCSVCGDRFVQKASLNYHMVKHHPDAC